MSNAPLNIRPLRASDLYRFGEVVTWEVFGLLAERDDQMVACGGINRFGDHWWAFCHIVDPAFRCAPFLHRAMLAGLTACDRLGFAPQYSYADAGFPRAVRWHQALGFRPIRDEERDVEIRVAESLTRGTATFVRGRS